jgi:hypothetical protein
MEEAVSSHADTIRRAIFAQDAMLGGLDTEACAALDALLAEIERLREALEQIARTSGNIYCVPSEVAREALAGDGEAICPACGKPRDEPSLFCSAVHPIDALAGDAE